MALWIRSTTETVTTQSVTPKNGKTFTLEEMQHFVGGYIEALDLQNGSVMYLNEEGKLNDLPYNPVADVIAHRTAGIAYDDNIVGDVLIATLAETGDEGRMTIDQVRTLKPGDTVTWNDPDEGLCSRTDRIASITVREDDTVFIVWQDDGELECYACELSAPDED